MKSVMVYCEVENQKVADISQELLSAGKRLAQKLGCPLEAMVFGSSLNGIENQMPDWASRLDQIRSFRQAVTCGQ